MNYIWWSEPEFSRTQADIDLRTAKSRLNASDLNRIEGNIGWLNDRWNILSADNSTWNKVEKQQLSWNDIELRQMIWGISTRQWFIGELSLFSSEINRIVRNAQTIKQAFSLQSEPFDTLLYWPDLNTIEKILFDAHQVYIGWLEWDCLECKFDTWDDLDGANITWNELERSPCYEALTWDKLEIAFNDWDALDNANISWSELECKSEE